MFNETGDHFIGLIISPYYSVAADTSLTLNCLPKVRAFITVQQSQSGGKCNGNEDRNIIPYEIQINVMPQRTIIADLLKEQILMLKNNPHATDKINLQKESCIIKGPKNAQLPMLKADKLMRSLMHLLEVNYYKMQAQIGFGHVGRHLECLIMTKDKIEFQPIDKIEEEPQPFIEEKKEESVDDDENDLDDGIFAKKAAANKRKKDEKGDAESVSKTETVATQSTAAAAAPAEELLEEENKEESKDSAQVQLPLKRKRGRPKKTDVRVSEEVVQPVASAKRVR